MRYHAWAWLAEDPKRHGMAQKAADTWFSNATEGGNLFERGMGARWKGRGDGEAVDEVLAG